MFPGGDATAFQPCGPVSAMAKEKAPAIASSLPAIASRLSAVRYWQPALPPPPPWWAYWASRPCAAHTHTRSTHDTHIPHTALRQCLARVTNQARLQHHHGCHAPHTSLHTLTHSWAIVQSHLTPTLTCTQMEAAAEAKRRASTPVLPSRTATAYAAVKQSPAPVRSVRRGINRLFTDKSYLTDINININRL